MKTADLIYQIHRSRQSLRREGRAVEPSAVYARMIPAAQDAWDANALPDSWLTAELYLLRQRLDSLARDERRAA